MTFYNSKNITRGCLHNITKKPIDINIHTKLSPIMKRFYVVIIAALTSALSLKAQPELTLPFMQSVFQSSYINPTVVPEHSFSLGIPGSSVFAQFVSNGFIPKNMFDYRNDTMHANLNSMLNDMGDNNLLYFAENADIFHIRTKVLNGFFWFGIRQNSTFSFNYPKDLFSLVIQGNEQFAGSSLDLSSMKINVMLYNEYTFGMMKEFPKWIFGGRISVLQGLSNVRFNPTVLKVNIDDETYAHVATADGKVETAGLPHNSDGDVDFDPVDGTWLTNYLTNFKNKGFALSGGVTYKYDDYTRLSFSFYDLGFITWKDSIQTYTINGQTNFDGFDILTNFLNDTDMKLDSLLDDMKDDFDRDTVTTKYRTWLNPKFTFSATYNIFSRTQVGFSFNALINQKLYPSLTLGVSQGVGRFFNIVGTASYNYRTISNLGVGLMIKPGPFQFFTVVDNTYPLINPLKVTNLNVRVGLNFVFGRIKQPDGLPFR